MCARVDPNATQTSECKRFDNICSINQYQLYFKIKLGYLRGIYVYQT